MTITIESPPELNDYFASPACHSSVYGAFDGLAMVGWHPDKATAQKLFYGFPLVKIYKDMRG